MRPNCGPCRHERLRRASRDLSLTIVDRPRAAVPETPTIRDACRRRRSAVSRQNRHAAARAGTALPLRRQALASSACSVFKIFGIRGGPWAAASPLHSDALLRVGLPTLPARVDPRAGFFCSKGSSGVGQSGTVGQSGIGQSKQPTASWPAAFCRVNHAAAAVTRLRPALFDS